MLVNYGEYTYVDIIFQSAREGFYTQLAVKRLKRSVYVKSLCSSRVTILYQRRGIKNCDAIGEKQIRN